MDDYGQPTAPPAGWYENSNGLLQWWDGNDWGPIAPEQNQPEQSRADDEQYRWVPMGTLTAVLGDAAMADRIDKSLARIPVVNFAAEKIPQPGQLVPVDCAWAFASYPGPLPAAAYRKSSVSKRFLAMGTLRGRPLNEIVSAAGNASMTLALSTGGTSHTWQEMRLLGLWQISLNFDQYGVCMGVGSELSL